MRKTVLLFQRVMVPYREAIFKKLNKVVNIIICFGKKGSSHAFHPEVNPSVPYYRIDSLYPIPKKESLVIQDVVTPLIKFKPDIVVVEFSILIISNWIIFILKPFLKYKLILWTQGYNRKTGFNPKRYFSDKLRVWWMNRANAVILYSQKAREIISPYIKNQQKIFVAQNSLDTKKLIQKNKDFEKIGKDNIKKRIGFTKGYNLIYLGRLVKEKEPDRAIDVFRIVSEKLGSVTLHIVGDGPLSAELKKQAKGLNIIFWGGISDDERLSELFFAADIMVMPGYLGLAVVYAFCFGVPVVSQKKGNRGPFHSPEVEYVLDGKTGFFVDYGDNGKMADVICGYLIRSDLNKTMKKNMDYIIKNRCSTDKMFEGFRKALGYLGRN